MADFVRRLERLRRRQRVERVIPGRINPLEVLSRSEIRQRYRFHPKSIVFLLGMIFNALESPTFRSSPLPPMISLLVTLQFFASGAHYLVIGDIHGVSKSSVSRAVRRTTAAICSLRDRYIKFPRNDAARAIHKEFYNIARFPKVIGVIDGTQIKIKGPKENETDFVNRKGYHSINVQMVCDARFRITNMVAKWPGSVHDSRIFRESELCRKFENGEINGLLLGDSGHPCRPYLMTPYLNTQTAAQERYNIALTKTRVLIEQTFGVLKRRFPCLSYGLRTETTSAPQVTVACVVLHNFGMDRGDILERTVDEPFEPLEAEVDINQAGVRCRDVFAATHFA
ncbi:putative nuclease HARBI1 [Mercenaria mercenaria]|uniref:putative nuclease HARBI1 n=1 Tax=Mercenaria mercenaria TaxID=6596 RepID=UPI00234EF97C|nr:putative nuclease HARBI1 [Mercenaria mercenaria]